MAAQVRHKAIALGIVDELAHSPWALTQNFLDKKHGRCQLALARAGDPSAQQAGHSFLRMRIRDAAADEKRAGTAMRRQPTPLRLRPPLSCATSRLAAAGRGSWKRPTGAGPDEADGLDLRRYTEGFLTLQA